MQDNQPDRPIVVIHSDPITQDTLDALAYEKALGVRVWATDEAGQQIEYTVKAQDNEAMGHVLQVGPELITDDQLAAVWAAMTRPDGVGMVPAVDQEYELCPSCAAMDAVIAADLVAEKIVSRETMARLFGLGDIGAIAATGAGDTFGQVY